MLVAGLRVDVEAIVMKNRAWVAIKVEVLLRILWLCP